MSDTLNVVETPNEEVSKPFGFVNLKDGSKMTIDDSHEDVKAFLAEFPDATIEVAIGTVTEKLQKEVDSEVVPEAPESSESNETQEAEVTPTEETQA